MPPGSPDGRETMPQSGGGVKPKMKNRGQSGVFFLSYAGKRGCCRSLGLPDGAIWEILGEKP